MCIACPCGPQIIGSVVDFEGETIFTENRVAEFGALQLLSFAQIRFMSGSRMKFVGNVGKYVRCSQQAIVYLFSVLNCYRTGNGLEMLCKIHVLFLPQDVLFTRLGASIVVDSPAVLSSFSDLLFNPKCFALYEDRAAPPSEWNNVSHIYVP